MENQKQCCELCGEEMTPVDGLMFKYHGYVRDCPKPPIQKPMNTLKQIQENSEKEFKQKYCAFEICDVVSFGDQERILNFLHQQTTLAYQAGREDERARCIKKLDDEMFTSPSEAGQFSMHTDVWNQAIEAMKDILLTLTNNKDE